MILLAQERRAGKSKKELFMMKTIVTGWSGVWHERNLTHTSFCLYIKYASGRSVYKDFRNEGLACAYAGRVKAKHPDSEMTLTTPCRIEPHYFEHSRKVLPSLYLITIPLF